MTITKPEKETPKRETMISARALQTSIITNQDKEPRDDNTQIQ